MNLGRASPNCEGLSCGSLTCHASCVVLDEDAVLVRGPSGAGKTALCLTLLDRWSARDRHARFLGDDRIVLDARHGRLVARPCPSLAGAVEVRGLGLRRLGPCAEAGVVRLVVDLTGALARMPDEPDPLAAPSVDLLGVRLPVLTLEPRQPREYLVDEVLVALQRRRTGSDSVSRQTHLDFLLKFDVGNL